MEAHTKSDEARVRLGQGMDAWVERTGRVKPCGFEERTAAALEAAKQDGLRGRAQARVAAAAAVFRTLRVVLASALVARSRLALLARGMAWWCSALPSLARMLDWPCSSRARRLPALGARLPSTCTWRLPNERHRPDQTGRG